MTIFLIAFFRFDPKGEQYGFERIHLQTFASTIEGARRFAHKCFCDEAGWYEGVLIEERKELTSFFRGKREWYTQQPGGQMVQIKEPVDYSNVINII